MNKIISLFALLTILSIFSCKDDEVESDMGTTNSLYLRFEIGGEQKEYTSLQAFWGGGTSTNGMDTYGTLWGFDGEIRIDFSQDVYSPERHEITNGEFSLIFQGAE